MLWTAKSCSASRKIRSLRPFAPRREQQARNSSSTVAQSSSVIRVSMVGSSQTDLPGVTDPRTWESTHDILDPIRPHSLGFLHLALLNCLKFGTDVGMRFGVRRRPEPFQALSSAHLKWECTGKLRLRLGFGHFF